MVSGIPTIILSSCLSLGWTFHSSTYCQMICHVTNKSLEWARNFAHEVNNGFLDVVNRGEASVQLETH